MPPCLIPGGGSPYPQGYLRALSPPRGGAITASIYPLGGHYIPLGAIMGSIYPGGGRHYILGGAVISLIPPKGAIMDFIPPQYRLHHPPQGQYGPYTPPPMGSSILKAFGGGSPNTAPLNPPLYICTALKPPPPRPHCPPRGLVTAALSLCDSPGPPAPPPPK